MRDLVLIGILQGIALVALAARVAWDLHRLRSLDRVDLAGIARRWPACQLVEVRLTTPPSWTHAADQVGARVGRYQVVTASAAMLLRTGDGQVLEIEAGRVLHVLSNLAFCIVGADVGRPMVASLVAVDAHGDGAYRSTEPRFRLPEGPMFSRIPRSRRWGR
jgi:hypothetical protein